MGRVDREADRKAIVAVIEEMTAAYFDKDFARWAECWVHESYVQRWMWFGRGGITVREGWDRQASLMRQAMERNPGPNPSGPGIRRENVRLRVGRDMAWVTFDQHGPKTGEPFDVPGLQKELRVLEKHEGQWKVAFFCALQRSLDYVHSPLLRADERGAVVWMNPAAAEQLRDHRSIRVRAGRLRAIDRAADQRLQAAIGWAASLDDGLADPDSILPFAVQNGALPIVLSGGRGLPADVCWVTASSGMVLVSIGDRQMTQDRLAAAAIVYGVTPAQMRLAELVVAGHAIVDAAKRLGISVNTARTHLQRMYDKTGVRSQPALVRALLSIGSPPI